MWKKIVEGNKSIIANQRILNICSVPIDNDFWIFHDFVDDEYKKVYRFLLRFFQSISFAYYNTDEVWLLCMVTTFFQRMVWHARAMQALIHELVWKQDWTKNQNSLKLFENWQIVYNFPANNNAHKEISTSSRLGLWLIPLLTTVHYHRWYRVR